MHMVILDAKKGRIKESHETCKGMLELDMILKQFESNVQGTSGICILNKRLFRIQNGKQNAYYKLIAHAYQSGLLEMPKVNMTPGFHYTFMVNGNPQVCKPTERLKEDNAYSLHYMVEKHQVLLSIAADNLPYNQDDDERLDNSMIAAGYFLVEQCKLFRDVFSTSIFAYGIHISKEGVIDSRWKEDSILEKNASELYKIIENVMAEI